MPPTNRWLLLLVLFTWHQIAHSIELPADAKSSTHTPLADQIAAHTADTSTSDHPISADNRHIKSPNDKSSKNLESRPESGPANHDNRLVNRLDKSPDKSEESSTLSSSDRKASSNLFLPSSVRAETTATSINNSTESLSNKAIINSSARRSRTAEANSSFEASRSGLPPSSTKLAESSAPLEASSPSAVPSGAPNPGDDGSKSNAKSILPVSAGAQRLLQFEQIHGGLLLINPTYANVSSKINRVN